jgi:hypothetical protein
MICTDDRWPMKTGTLEAEIREVAREIQEEQGHSRMNGAIDAPSGLFLHSWTGIRDSL